ncbi:hypothetical protein BJP34_05720 [Moorena producens PAL-8-15-08-1]|uniref:Uncharacterized protein n=1 Tax=Moorena producens PAL-8-15-08-1 TaxID=1458985 RepID=A0A1D8TN00_9CYAN|nr:AAA family ATPase [Moorena producens]AOW99009.1 hypothetical protein BJP34_05720 [Moorena producens PAL-8-15-08-1]
MKLEAVNIKNFRSIQEVALEYCGCFNVIVGKNNAGKSNILLAVNAFFESLNKGEPIVLEPPIGESIDHYEKSQNKAIEITMFFKISLDERDSLLQDIVDESPQVKNSVERIELDLRLAVTQEVMTYPKKFAYVKRIALCKYSSSTSSEKEIVHTILEINSDAAQELFTKESRAQELEDEIEQVKLLTKELVRFSDEDEWKQFKSNESSFKNRLLYPHRMNFIHTSRISISLSDKLDKLIQSTDSKSDFSHAIESLIDNMQEKANNLRSDPIQNRIDSFAGREDSVPRYALNLIKQIGEMNVLYLTERRDPIGKREAAKLLDLKVTRGGPEKLRAIQNTVSALLGVDIDAFAAKDSPMYSIREEPEAELDVDKFLVEVNGSGIREALRLILDYELNHPNILLVEEPEIHLHPALETSIMRYLKTIGKDCQIFITTHSTNFLDTAEMNNVYLASRHTSTNIKLINVEEEEESILRELGIRLSSIFMFDRLVFVEGPTDEDVIREWALICNINLAQASVGFVSMGGARNLAHFATEATINFLTKRRISIFFVIDRDERDVSEIDRLTDRIGDNAKLIVLKKRELENYLLCPRAISKFIEYKHLLAGEKTDNIPIISESDIETAIDTCADDLKDFVIERKVTKITCSPIYPNRSAVLSDDSDKSLLTKLKNEYQRQRQELSKTEQDLEEIIKEQTCQVKKIWQSKKKDLVPGDILLDNVCQRFDVRFNKQKDSARLAALMEENEIDSEVKDLVKSFAELSQTS